MDIAAAVTTAKRRVNYLPDTLNSLWLAGFERPLVVRDGDPRLGPKACFKRALWLCRESEWIAIFQDDVLAARGLRVWLERQELTRGVWSLYCASKHDGADGWAAVDLTPTESQPVPWHSGLGACALLMPADVADAYLESDPQFRKGDQIGGSLGQFCYQQSIPFYVYRPSLIQHVGEESCLHGHPITDERRASRFCADVRDLGGAAELSTPFSYPANHLAIAPVSGDYRHNGCGERA